MEKIECPIWHKTLLTIEEAAAYFGIGTSKLREMTNNKDMEKYIIWNGSKRLFKRELFDRYLETEYSI